MDEAVLSESGTLAEGSNEVYVPVQAGDVIGKSAANYSQSALLDMTTNDRSVSAEGLIHPEKYGPARPHAVNPLDYFQEELKTTLYSKVLRQTPPPGREV